MAQRGWTPEKAEVFAAGFEEFARHVRVNSKEKGPILLGESLYRAQTRFLSFIFSGLSNDIHDFKHMKSRQLGISTVSRALTLFWGGVHDGLKGYMILDTAPHKEEARLELIGMIKSLPDKYKFPRIVRENRDLVVLENETIFNFAAAGVRETRTAGTLGRGSGVNFVHSSEISSWAPGENIVAFMNTLAHTFPDRLYIWESTGRGPGLWDEMWEQAKADEFHQAALFSGWWSREDQMIERDDPDFERYGRQEPTPQEMKKIQLVKDMYDWQITPEQLAWVRRYTDPLAKHEGDTPAEFVGDVYKVREQAWTEMDAALTADTVFFHPDALNTQREKYGSNLFKSYWFEAGVEFTDLKVRAAPNAASIELKVWEEPQEQSVYVVAADPAFGSNEHSDRSAIQVLRCYADGLDQVAEYASPLITTNQFAWVILALAAWYAGDTSEVYLIVELNGPGMATWDEIQVVRRNLQNGYYLSRHIESQGLGNILRNVRNYIYSRPDSFTAGKALQWKMTSGAGPSGKVRLMERYRDFMSNEMLHVRSLATLKEAEAITRVGDTIEAPGSHKDDRNVALALGIQAWEQRARRSLIAQKRTRENDAAKRRMSVVDTARLFHSNQLEAFFRQKNAVRRHEQALIRGAKWRAR